MITQMPSRLYRYGSRATLQIGVNACETTKLIDCSGFEPVITAWQSAHPPNWKNCLKLNLATLSAEEFPLGPKENPIIIALPVFLNSRAYWSASGVFTSDATDEQDYATTVCVGLRTCCNKVYAAADGSLGWKYGGCFDASPRPALCFKQRGVHININSSYMPRIFSE